MWFTVTWVFNKNLNGGTQTLTVSAGGSGTSSSIGSKTGQGDPTSASIWGKSTPFLGFYGTTGGSWAQHLVNNVIFSPVQQCSPPSAVVRPAGIYASNDAAGGSYTYTCLPGYTTVGSPATLLCGSGATALTNPPTCTAPTSPLPLMLNANTWTLGADAVWAAASSPNLAPGACVAFRS